ncbi:hypothetical protein D1816_18610 [Aquimarina sp. AD10]|uniref:Uncharacterized protein n=1 Tax=Aquimarina aggregata TaxID=1642818 RepID=A0A162ZQX0_9FLAO|nr:MULTISPECIES: hypothetical protein [Aquimarina]AXT62288.1 hypothetical protein D1816_18610 [Aquimarina sp. AD10]KZS39967.1 hypothetical protein AWE51_10020 [Aquimarina aggregata]RKM90517.1 hypothetical protein D7033_23770 [Aquimarina sp. AD10]
MKFIPIIALLLSVSTFGQKKFDYKNIIGEPIEAIGVFHKAQNGIQRLNNDKVLFYKYYYDYTWYNRKMGYTNIITDSNHIIKSVRFNLEKTITRDLFDALVADFGEPTQITVRIEPPYSKSPTEANYKTKDVKKYCDAASSINFEKDSLKISVSSYSSKKTTIELKTL